MPPPDTIHITDRIQIPDSINSLIDSILLANRIEFGYEKAEEHHVDLSWLLVIVVLAGIAIIAGLLISIIKHFLSTSKKKGETIAVNATEENATVYDSWLSMYNPYYATLSPELKSRFIYRVIQFIQSKKFSFHSVEPDEQAVVLISGAAIQISFGLKNFLLDHYPVINVIKKEYVLKADNDTYYGHVSRNGIYVSWKHFQEGYEDYSDSVNVGLHEMAHALSFDAYLGNEDIHDRKFKTRLQNFVKDGVPVFRALKSTSSHVLDDYASTNFDEFWAVSVETFFENTESFRQNLPELYQEMCETLNQDPLSPSKIIDSHIAGF